MSKGANKEKSPEEKLDEIIDKKRNETEALRKILDAGRSKGVKSDE